MRPSFTMAIEALGTLVEDKTWLTAASIFAFASSGKRRLGAERRDDGERHQGEQEQ